jgi:hypothetical protein
VNLAGPAIGFVYGGIDHLDHHRGDVDADAITFDEGNDGVVGMGWPGMIFCPAAEP